MVALKTYGDLPRKLPYNKCYPKWHHCLNKMLLKGGNHDTRKHNRIRGAVPGRYLRASKNGTGTLSSSPLSLCRD